MMTDDDEEDEHVYMVYFRKESKCFADMDDCGVAAFTQDEFDAAEKVNEDEGLYEGAASKLNPYSLPANRRLDLGSLVRRGLERKETKDDG
jgi:hypothetical protein